MKLLRYSLKHERAAQARLGVLVGKDLVADLRAGYARYLIEEIGNPKGHELAELFLPAYFAQFLHVGAPAWEALAEAYGWLSDLVKSKPGELGLDGTRLFLPLSECRVYAPVRGSKIIVVDRNYPGHGKSDERRAGEPPCAFMKAPSCVVRPGRDILRPAGIKQLDCESHLAVVIGRRCKRVPPEKAYDVIAGYTILNDVTARDPAGADRQKGYPLLRKNSDTFAPLGPWVVTKVEVQDPMNLRIRTLVNGEVRDEGNTRDMIHSVPELVSHLSQMTLMPGDVIATGSPRGAGSTHPESYLNAGDVIECEIEKIGTLINAVVDEPAP
jgi:2-keto-4-pentenoate hydratase/2-oxohepta-3-ene-1,7-dioic acid hydratase in catechol pathway